MRAYAEEKLPAKLPRDIETHFGACTLCREFRERTIEALARSFREAQPLQPPESVWLKIKESLEARQAAAVSSGSFWERTRAFLDPILTVPRIVMGGAGLAFAVLLIVLLTHVPPRSSSVSNYLGDQMLNLMGISENGQDPDTGNGSLGTSVEQYFFS